LILRSGTPEDDAAAKEASKIIARIFADKLTFTQMTYVRQWAHADRLLADIDAAPEADDEADEPLAATIDRLLGTSALAFVRRAHAAYGEALEITKAAKEAPGGVREPKRRVEVAIVQYALTLFAVHPPNTSDETNALLAQARRPTAEVRAAQSSPPKPSADQPGADQPGTDQPTVVDPIPAPPDEPMGPPPDEPIPVID